MKLADAYLRFHVDSAQLYAQTAGIESVRLNYEWGVWKSKFLMSQIEFSRGNVNLSQVKTLKTACADWFEKNDFQRDALNVKLSLNQEGLYTKGHEKAQQQAKRLLREAEVLNEPMLIAAAWSQIFRFRNHFIDTDGYAQAHDSTQFYFELAKDSLSLLLNACQYQLQQNGGRFSEAEIQRFDAIAARWDNPTLNAVIARMKCYRSAIAMDTSQTNLLATEVKNLEGSIMTLRFLPEASESQSLAYRFTTDYRQVVRIGHELEKRYLKQHDTFRLSLAYNKLGEGYNGLQDDERAIHYFLASMPLSEILGNEYTFYSVKRRLAGSYVKTNANAKAERLFKEVIAWASEQKNNRVIQILMGNTYGDLAKMYQSQGQYEKALQSFRIAVHQFHPANFRSLDPLVNMWSLFLDQNEIAQADSIRTAILSGNLAKDVSWLEEFHFQEGRLFIAQNRLKAGLKSLNTYIESGASNTVTENKKKAHFLCYKTYKALSQHEEALAAFEVFNAIDDSLRARQVVRNVQRIQSEYELSMKDAELAQLRQKGELAELRLIQQENTLSLRNLYNGLLALALIGLLSVGYLLFKRFQRKKEEEQQSLRNQLEIENLKAKQKVQLAEVKNDIYANMSHELRTPLTLIRVPLMNVRGRALAEDQPILDSVLKNTDYLMDMLDELLNVSKMESESVDLQKAHVDLAASLSQIKLNFTPLFAKKQLHLDWCMDLKNPTFFGDEKKLHIVLNNLLNNAFYHSFEGGCITFNMRCDDGLRVDVTNTGKPIPEAELPHLFERAYRGSESIYPGTGIGLAWTKQIVELHGGTISVDNSQKDQVTFSVIIPGDIHVHSEEPQEDFFADEMESSAMVNDQPHVLVVEDNREMRNLIRDTLIEDYRMDFADNGKTGEEMVEKLQPELVLSDVMMPEKDGFELLRSLKTRFNSSHIPVILLTALGDSGSRVAGLDQDADDYISKPFDPNELKARMNNLLRQREQLHKLFSENPLLYGKDAKCSALDADFIDRARKVLEDNYTNGSFSVTTFSIALAINRTSLNAKIRALTNQSSAEYIRNFRLEKASRMLATTDSPIAQVCIDTGFNTVRVFNKAFKRRFGLTPSEHRAQGKSSS